MVGQSGETGAEEYAEEFGFITQIDVPGTRIEIGYRGLLRYIEKKFSMSFTLYTPNDSTHSYTLLTLKNDEDYLHLHYRASDDKFVVSLSDGTEFSLADFSGREDYLHFMISQGDGYFTFVIYSLAYDSYVISRKKYTDLKVYNQLALYKDLGGYNAS